MNDLDTIIKTFDEKKQVICLDTNVLLKLYRYEPEFREYALSCLNQIDYLIILPSLVCTEFKRNYKSLYYKYYNKYDAAMSKIINPLNKFKDTIKKEINNMIVDEAFDDIEKIYSEIDEKCKSIESDVEKFFEVKKCDINFIKKVEENKDKIFETFSQIMNNGLKQPKGFMQEELYTICLEGENRFNRKVPPGYKDIKKNSIRKYGDLIIWKEMIEYSIKYDKDILFISDDKKSDWCDEKGQLLEDLKKEFLKYTGNNIIHCNSKELYICVGKYCNIQKSTHLDLMLSFTTDEYINNINENIYNNIESKIESLAIDYIESPNIGTEGLENVYIEEHEFLDCESIENDDNIIIYTLIYRIKIFANSKDFICYDDIDKEDIFTGENEHEFECIVAVKVERDISNMSVIENNSQYNKVEIADYHFEEISFKSWVD